MVLPSRAYAGCNERQTSAFEGKHSFIKGHRRANNLFIKTQLKGGFSSPLHLLSQVGGCVGDCCSLLTLSTYSLSWSRRKAFPISEMREKKIPILWPKVLHQLFLHCFEEGHIYIQLKSVPGWSTDSVPGPNSGQHSLLSESLWWVLEAGNMIHP